MFKHYKALREAGWILDGCDYSKDSGPTNVITQAAFRNFVASTESPAEVKPKPKPKPPKPSRSRMVMS